MLLAAARKCDRNAIEALLDDGESVNQREIDEARPRKDGATPLHVVVQQSNSELVELLLARGADVTQAPKAQRHLRVLPIIVSENFCESPLR